MLVCLKKSIIRNIGWGLIISPTILGFPLTGAFFANIVSLTDDFNIKLFAMFLCINLLPFILGVYLVSTTPKIQKLNKKIIGHILLYTPVVLCFPMIWTFIANIVSKTDDFNVKLFVMFLCLIICPIMLGIYLIQTNKKSSELIDS